MNVFVLIVLPWKHIIQSLRTWAAPNRTSCTVILNSTYGNDDMVGLWLWPPQELTLTSLIYCSYIFIILLTFKNLTVCLCVNCMHRIYCEEGKLWRRERDIEWRGFSIIYWCTRTHCFKPAWTDHNATELFNCSYHHNGNIMFIVLMYVALWLKYRY